MTRILILCTGNSCRSQMAEGWFRYFTGDRAEIYSAGVEAHGLNPRAVKVMEEIGIDISGQTSNLVDDYRDVEFDTIITVCDSARERCPWFPSGGERIHHSFPDPADAVGTEEEILDVFRSVRDKIGDYVREFVERKNLQG